MHERVLRIIYKDCTNTFDEILSKDNYFRIHLRNLQRFAAEIFKAKLGLAPGNMKNELQFIEGPYDSRTETKFSSRNVRIVRYDIKTASSVVPEFGAAFLESTMSAIL